MKTQKSVASDQRSEVSGQTDGALGQRALPNTTQYRRLTYSPNEEHTVRCLECGAPEPISESLIFLLLTDLETRTVTKNGIQFKPPGATESLLYWDPVSEIFDDANVGQIVKFRFDPDDHQLIYVLRANGSLWDVLPADTKPAMLDTAAQSAMRSRTEIPYRMAQAKLTHYHAPTVAAETARKKQNALRMNSTRTFPVPAGGRSQEPEVRSQNFETRPQPQRETGELLANDSAGASACDLDSSLMMGTDRMQLSRADAVQGDPASAATPTGRAGAFPLGPNTSEPVALETKRESFGDWSSEMGDRRSESDQLPTSNYQLPRLSQRSHLSASATSPDAGEDAGLAPAPRHNLSEADRMVRGGRRARVRVAERTAHCQSERDLQCAADEDLSLSLSELGSDGEV